MPFRTRREGRLERQYYEFSKKKTYTAPQLTQLMACTRRLRNETRLQGLIESEAAGMLERETKIPISEACAEELCRLLKIHALGAR